MRRSILLALVLILGAGCSPRRTIETVPRMTDQPLGDPILTLWADVGPGDSGAAGSGPPFVLFESGHFYAQYTLWHRELGHFEGIPVDPVPEPEFASILEKIGTLPAPGPWSGAREFMGFGHLPAELREKYISARPDWWPPRWGRVRLTVWRAGDERIDADFWGVDPSVPGEYLELLHTVLEAVRMTPRKSAAGYRGAGGTPSPAPTSLALVPRTTAYCFCPPPEPDPEAERECARHTSSHEPLSDVEVRRANRSPAGAGLRPGRLCRIRPSHSATDDSAR